MQLYISFPVVVVQSPNCVHLFVTPWTAAHQASLSFTISQSLPKFMSIQRSHPLMPSSPSALSLSQHQGLVQWVSGSHQMTTILKLQHQSFQWVFRVDFPSDWLVWAPCCPRDSQESSPAPQFKGINSLLFWLLYGPVLTTIHDHWEGHSLDYMDLCQQSNVSAFRHTV